LVRLMGHIASILNISWKQRNPCRGIFKRKKRKNANSEPYSAIPVFYQGVDSAVQRNTSLTYDKKSVYRCIHHDAELIVTRTGSTPRYLSFPNVSGGTFSGPAACALKSYLTEISGNKRKKARNTTNIDIEVQKGERCDMRPLHPISERSVLFLQKFWTSHQPTLWSISVTCHPSFSLLT